MVKVRAKRVQVNAAEFLREEPLESDLRRALDAALRLVEGVADVIGENREPLDPRLLDAFDWCQNASATTA